MDKKCGTFSLGNIIFLLQNESVGKRKEPEKNPITLIKVTQIQKDKYGTHYMCISTDKSIINKLQSKVGMFRSH